MLAVLCELDPGADDQGRHGAGDQDLSRTGLGDVTKIGIEGTGSYGAGLASSTSSAGSKRG